MGKEIRLESGLLAGGLGHVTAAIIFAAVGFFLAMIPSQSVNTLRLDIGPLDQLNI